MEPSPIPSRYAKISLCLALHLVSERLDEVRATERICDMRDVGLVGDDLLGTQRDPCRLLGGQGHRLVHRVGVQRLGTTQHPCQRFDRRAHNVHFRLLRG